MSRLKLYGLKLRSEAELLNLAFALESRKVDDLSVKVNSKPTIGREYGSPETWVLQ